MDLAYLVVRRGGYPSVCATNYSNHRATHVDATNAIQSGRRAHEDFRAFGCLKQLRLFGLGDLVATL